MSMPDAILAIFGFGLPELILLPLILVGPVLLGLWIWMLVDVVTKEPATGNDRIVWLLVVLLAGVVGAAIYFFARKLPRDRTRQAARPPGRPAA